MSATTYVIAEETSRHTRRDRIKALLADGHWHHSAEIALVGGDRFQARIGELRREENLVIVQRRNAKTGRQEYQLLGPRTPETERAAKEYESETKRKKPLYLDEKETTHLMTALYAFYLQHPEAFKRSELKSVYGRLKKLAPADFDVKKNVQPRPKTAAQSKLLQPRGER